MANCKVMIWNIECFGTFNHLKLGAQGSNRIHGTLWAIAQIVHCYSADVLIIQEFRQQGTQYFPILQQFLNQASQNSANWHYDFLPGSVETAQGQGVTGINDLTYTQTGNMEGYAVFWKNTIPLLPFNQPAPSPWVKMSYGMNGNVHNQGYINLVVESHSYTEIDNKFLPFRLDLNQPIIPAVFPRPNSEPVGNINIHVHGQYWQSQRRQVLFWNSVRRPCIILIKTTQAISSQIVNIQGANHNVIPIIVHHGHNKGLSPLYSVNTVSLNPFFWAGGPSNSPKPLIYGGDLNTSSREDLLYSQDNLNYFNMQSATGTYSQNPSTSTIKAGFRRSQTQYEYGFTAKQKGLIRNGDNYEEARDILYHRDLTNLNPNAGVIDILQELITQQSPLANALFLNDLNGSINPLGQSVHQAIQASQNPNPSGNTGLPPLVAQDLNLVNDLAVPFQPNAPKHYQTNATGNYSPLLPAAILYRGLITDHLPLVIQFDI